MLYSEEGDRLVFVVDKGSFPQDSIRDVVDGVYSSIKSRQVTKVAKQEFKLHRLIQELVEPACDIKEMSLEGELTHDDTYYLEMAAFEFEDTDFLVPTNQFIQKTEDFATMFVPTLGTFEAPYQFPGVTAKEFRSLMNYFYPLDDKKRLTVNKWIHILRLSTKWRMPNLREEAIQKLNSKIDRLSAVMKVQLGKECNLAEWVRSGYVALVERREHFTEADVIAIGLEDVTKLCEIREQGFAGEWDTYLNRLTLEAHGTSNLIADKISQISTVDHLDYDDDDFVMAILDAQSLGNRRLMLDAWGRMARRLESLTLDEVERLTLGTTLMMWEVRLEMRRAAWSLVQEYGTKCNVKALSASQRIDSAFASELEDIEVQALHYASFKPSPDKGKEPAVNTNVDDREEEEEEIPHSSLEPMPNKNSLLTKSLELRQRIKDLEKKFHKYPDTSSGRKLRNDLRRLRLSAQKWYTSAADSNISEPTLDLNTISPGSPFQKLKPMIAKMVLKNTGKLSLDGSRLTPKRWRSMKSCIVGWRSQRYNIETQILEDSRVIELILPVSES